MNIKNWIISFWSTRGSKVLTVGSRVNTKFGVGTVTGGAVNVELDSPARMARNGTFNIGITERLDTVEVL